MYTRVLRAAIYLFLALSIFSLFRLAIFFSYPEAFQELTSPEVLLSFFTGIRVDVITIFTFTSLIILLMLFPLSTFNKQKFQVTLAALFYLILIVMIGALYGDFLYFEHVHRHTSSEVLYLGEDGSVVIESLKQNWLGVLAVLLTYALLFRLFIMIETKYRKDIYFNLKNISIFILIFLVMFSGIRGKVVGKPFGIIDAFSSDSADSGHLALNGIYSVYRSSSRDGKAVRFMDHSEAIKITQNLLNDETFQFVDNNYPLIRRLSDNQKKNPDFAELKNANVVIFFLEGWSSLYVDSFSQVGFQVTPNFDALAKDGIQYSNFFSNGQRSIDGITALFSGIPRVAGINRLGSGLEVSDVSFIGDLADQNGYQTLAMQSSKRSSFRLDSIARLAGFDEYYGAEDIPVLGIETSGKQPYFGTWDNNTFQFLLGKINQINAENNTRNSTKPFLAFAFSSTTHTPFISPGTEWEKYTHNDYDMYGFLNTLYYADDAIGRFMASAKKEPWFDNTIFIFMADHTVGFGEEKFLKDFKAPDRPIEQMRIPLVIYAPALIKAGIDERPASQADIIPTLVHLLSWNGDFTSISNSLFSKASRFSILEQGPVVSYVKSNGYLQHNLDKILKNTFDDSHAETELLAVYQSMTNLLKENKFYKDTTLK